MQWHILHKVSMWDFAYAEYLERCQPKKTAHTHSGVWIGRRFESILWGKQKLQPMEFCLSANFAVGRMRDTAFSIAALATRPTFGIARRVRARLHDCTIAIHTRHEKWAMSIPHVADSQLHFDSIAIRWFCAKYVHRASGCNRHSVARITMTELFRSNRPNNIERNHEDEIN